MTGVERISGRTWHGRKGTPRNAFAYAVDYLLVDADAPSPPLRLFRRNRPGLMALWDRDQGGPPGGGRGAAWLREALTARDLPGGDRVLLLAQPRVLGHVFNPVAFWLCHDAEGRLRCVVAEVTNTFGDRHSYLCHRDDLAPITRHDVLTARKLLHVSPFQPVTGGYAFTFDIDAERIAIRIDYTGGAGGIVATLAGRRRRLTDRGVLAICLRRPFGSRRVLALIHWQALKLWWKGAGYRRRPDPPAEGISR